MLCYFLPLNTALKNILESYGFKPWTIPSQTSREHPSPMEWPFFTVCKNNFNSML